MVKVVLVLILYGMIGVVCSPHVYIRMAALIQESNTGLLPATATVLGVQERHDRNKKGKYLYEFKIEVEWSDGSKTTCCHDYDHFFQLQCKLLDSFPDEAGKVKGKQRTIPFIPGKQIFRRNTKQLALERMPKLDDYLKELLSLPQQISHCCHVINFLSDDQMNETVRFVCLERCASDDNLLDDDRSDNINDYITIP